MGAESPPKLTQNLENRDECIYPNASVLLFYCPPRPAQKDYFPTMPFLKTKKYKRRDKKTLRLFEHEKLCDSAS